MKVYFEEYFAGIGWLYLSGQGDYRDSDPLDLGTIRKALLVMGRYSPRVRITIVDADGPLHLYPSQDGNLSLHDWMHVK